MFNDLIPDKKSNTLSFDDLIQQRKDISFDDIPKEENRTKTRGQIKQAKIKKDKEKTYDGPTFKNMDTIGSSIAQSLHEIGNSMRAYPSITQNLTAMILSPKPNDTVAKGLGYKNAEEMRQSELAYNREKLLQSAGDVEQVTGAMLAGVMDPAALGTGAYGLTAKGFARLFKLSAAGGGYGGVLEATHQLAETGKITDAKQIALLAAVGGVAAPSLDKLVRVGLRLNNVRQLKQIEAKTQEYIERGINPQSAYDRALKQFKMTSNEIASVVDGTGRTQHFMEAVKPIKPNEVQNTLLKSTINKFKSVVNTGKEKFDYGLRPISSAIEEINPSILNALRKHDMMSHIKTNEWRSKVSDFIEVHNKLPKIAQRQLKKDLLNQNFQGGLNTLRSFVDDKTATTVLSNVKNIYSEILNEYRKVGIDPGELGDYFHRAVKNGHYKNIINKLGAEPRSRILKAIEEKESRIGRELSDKERSDLLNSLAIGVDPKGLRIPRPARPRVINELTDDLLDDYADLPDSLYSYIDHAAVAVAERQFFGRHINNIGNNIIDYKDSIGALMSDLLKRKEITVHEADKLSKLLTSRFGYKESSSLVTGAKNLFYVTKLAQADSALTQLGDLGIAAYSNGLLRTFNTFNPLAKQSRRLIPEDIGALKISAEFGSTANTANMMHKLFKASGFTAIDKLGKRAHINAALRKNENLLNKTGKARIKGEDKFKERWQKYFLSETGNLIDDLRNGNMSDNVKLMLWNELADVQPIALSEMPEKYLLSNGGRILYALKTFHIKQLDLMRRQMFSKIASGDHKQMMEGSKNLVRFGMMFTAANMSADTLKNWISGKDIEWDDMVISNLWKNFAISEYQVNQATKNKRFATTTTEYILGAVTGIAETFDDVIMDLSNVGEWTSGYEFESLKDVPVLGRVLYNQFGKGATKRAERKQKELLNGESDY